MKNTGIRNINMINSKWFLAIALIAFTLVGSLIPAQAYAGEGQWYGSICTMEKKETFTGSGIYQWRDTKQFAIVGNTPISDIILSIKHRLIGVSMKIYEIVHNNPQYVLAAQAAITLYFIIYGILFTTGMVQAKVYDFVVRMIKVGIIAVLLSSSSWEFFNDYVVKFFDSATDQTILIITKAGSTSVPEIDSVLAGVSPMSYLDAPVTKVVSSKMFVTLMAVATTEKYGAFYFLLMFLGVISFLKSVMMALWVYVMSMVMKTLLYGLAPIFIPTLLFNRTRHIFDGWVAQLVNATLQPVLLFIFFFFFVRLMEGAVDNMMQTPICFNKLPEGIRGTPFDFSFWRFMGYDSNGEWAIKTDGWKPTDPFPISVISVLTFFTIAELANKFNTVIIQISNQISQSSVNLMGDGGPVNTVYQSLASGAKMKRTP